MSDAPTRAETRDSETVPASEGVDGEAVGEASVTPYEDAASPQTPKAAAPIMSGAPDMKTGAQPQEEGPLDGSAETHAEYIRRLLDEGRPHFLAGLGFETQRDETLFQGCYLTGKIISRTLTDTAAETALDELCDKLNARGDSRAAKLIDLMSRSADGKSTVHRRKMTVYIGASFWFAWNPDDQPDAVAAEPKLPCPSGDRETAIAAARAAGGIDDINELYRIWALEIFEPGSGKLGALSKGATRKAGSPAAAKQVAQNKAADRKASRLASAAGRTARASLAKQPGMGKAVCSVCGREGLQFTSAGNVRPHHAHGTLPGYCPGGGKPPAEKMVTPQAIPEGALSAQGDTVSGTVPTEPTSPAEAGVYTPQKFAAAGAHAKSVYQNQYVAERQRRIAEGTLSQENSDEDQVEKVAGFALAFYAEQGVSAKTGIEDDYPIQVWGRIKNEATGAFELYGPMHDSLLCTAVLYQIAQENREFAEGEAPSDDTAAA